jgi:hypothetical protein
MIHPTRVLDHVRVAQTSMAPAERDRLSFNRDRRLSGSQASEDFIEVGHHDWVTDTWQHMQFCLRDQLCQNLGVDGISVAVFFALPDVHWDGDLAQLEAPILSLTECPILIHAGLWPLFESLSDRFDEGRTDLI